MNILWHHRPRYNSPETSGANVRLLNLAKELEKQGHRVYLLLDDLPSDDVSAREAFIEQVKKDTSISGVFHFRFSSPYNRIMGAMVRKLLHPALVNVILRRYHLRMSKQVLDLIDSLKIDAFITSLRDRLWLLPFLKRRVVIVVDWCDSDSLASVRRLKLSWKQKVVRGSVATVKAYTLATVQEAYYGRMADLNLLASPIDAAWLTRLSRAPEKTHVVLNGAVAASRPVPKVAKRLIFSGRMDFPPNHEAALWFIDRVLPLVVQRDPTVKLVIAGADPLPELCARASAHVSIVGFVEDIATEIAASELYVAPMITGSGFKNKVAEALVNGTFVVGTSLAFEFLSEEFREMLLVGDTAEELANHVLHFLSNPGLFDTNLTRLQKLASQKLQWRTQAEMLARLIRMVTDGRASQRKGSSCSEGQGYAAQSWRNTIWGINSIGTLAGYWRQKGKARISSAPWDKWVTLRHLIQLIDPRAFVKDPVRWRHLIIESLSAAIKTIFSSTTVGVLTRGTNLDDGVTLLSRATISTILWSLLHKETTILVHGTVDDLCRFLGIKVKVNPSVRMVIGSTGLLIVFGQLDNSNVLVHAAVTPDSRASLRLLREGTGIGERALNALVPKILHADEQRIISSCLPGRPFPVRTAKESELQDAIILALTPLIHLYATGGQDVSPDAEFVSKVSKFVERHSRRRELQCGLQLLDRWERRTVRAITVHGDYWLRNVLFFNGQLSGIVDWDRARRNGCSCFDALHLGFMSYAMWANVYVSELLADLWTDTWHFPWLRTYCARLCQEFSLDSRDLKSIAALLWLSYFYSNPHPTPEWEDLMIRPVFEAIIQSRDLEPAMNR